MPSHDKIYLYRMTHIGNIPHILEFGITHVSSPHANPQFVSVGDQSLISTRTNHLLDNGKRLGDYIPFYFGARTPMLFVMQRGFNNVPATAPEDIVYCVSTLQKIVDLSLDFVFTDGHAIDSFSSLYYPDNIDDINNLLDFDAINAKYWRDEADLDRKRRKEAEFLVLGDIPLNAISGYIVYNEQAKAKLMEYGIGERFVVIKNNFYF
ncbi:protein of unknown function [bacterium A37T11]|nr:protein of unknown function [bacterium A37T11]